MMRRSFFALTQKDTIFIFKWDDFWNKFWKRNMERKYMYIFTFKWKIIPIILFVMYIFSAIKKGTRDKKNKEIVKKETNICIFSYYGTILIKCGTMCVEGLISRMIKFISETDEKQLLKNIFSILGFCKYKRNVKGGNHEKI